MQESGSVHAADTPATIGLGESVHAPFQRCLAVALCLVLAGLALFAVRFGSLQGPEVAPFLPIVATAWALADLLTAFLLLTQFYVNGTTFFTALAAAYALSGLLTWPYLLALPGLFRTASGSAADQQISIWLWSLWHAAFPIVVGISMLCDPTFEQRIFSRRVTRRAVCATVAAALCSAVVLTALTFAQRSTLPTLFSDGHLQPAFGHFVAPAIALLDVLGCCLLLRRGRAMTTLQLWLFVALFSALLDVLLYSTFQSRYSYGWYAGALETLMTASVVLGMLLYELTGLYRRLAEMATIDILTQLYNRRALQDHMRLVLSHAKRQQSGLGLLMVDVDLFKGYNDSYGHARGDECLRRLAALIKSAATRPLDLTARYGGEEFVVLVPDTPRAGVVAVAEHILACIESAAIPYAAYARGHVTVSAGVGYIANARNADGDTLFEVADRALYQAKARGRNTFVVEDYIVAPSSVAALRRSDARPSST